MGLLKFLGEYYLMDFYFMVLKDGIFDGYENGNIVIKVRIT
jgi:hypothetical protein